MSSVFLAVIAFATLGGIANYLQISQGRTYVRNWPLFLTLFILGIVAVLWATEVYTSGFFINQTGIVIAILTVVSFLAFERWWGRTRSASDMYRPDTLPEAFHHMLIPKPSASIVKVVEVFFQDVVALVIVLGLLTTYDVWLAGLLFALLVFALHVPGPGLYGRVYGTVLLALSTAMALIVPYVISTYPFGFYLIFAIHLAAYNLIVLTSFFLRRHAAAFQIGK